MMKKMILVMMMAVCIWGSGYAEKTTEEMTEEQVLFEEVVTGVTKRQEKTYEAAANVTVISGKFLERYAIRNINDLFEVLEGGFHTHKGMDEVLILRGVAGYANDKILFLYDGMLFPTFLGLGENNWPAGSMDEVERIEIIKGPNTSIWGGQATQGTINIVHKGADQFKGLKTSVVAGKNGMARYIVNYANKPTEDLSYQLYANSVYFKGFYNNSKEWWGNYYNNLNAHDLVNPIPDYEVFANAIYKNFTLAYRRLQSRTKRVDEGDFNSFYIENYADDINVILRNPDFMTNIDWTTTVRFNNFYQMYDVFHFNRNYTGSGGYEMKTEKRYEADTNFLFTPIDKLSLVFGVQGSLWSPQGSGPSVGWNPWTRVWDPNIPHSGNNYDPPEFLPTFSEMGNDVAAFETYIDAQYKMTDKITLTGGGRYVSEFNPGDQFRDEREKLHHFFPKMAVVYSPRQNLYLKSIYQQAFTRLNTFERYAEQVNVDKRGSQKATNSESIEFVVDWKPVKNMKVLASYYQATLYDFVNFIYTGTSWPVINPALGEVRGFFNIGDHKVRGLEANVSYDWKNMGGFISGSQLFQNQVKNLVQPGFASGSGVIDDKDADFNRASVPRYNVSVGAYYDLTENYSVSSLWKMHQKIQVRSEEPWMDYYSPYVFTGGSTVDLVGVARNIWIKNLNLSVIGKNVLNAKYLKGSAMDPGHSYSIDPVQYEVKVSYLW